MASIMKVIAVINAIISIIGVLFILVTAGFFVALITAIAGMASILMILAIAEILQNQEDMREAIKNIERILPSLAKDLNIVCDRCNNNYDSTCRSCPHCGNRPGDKNKQKRAVATE